MGAFHAAYTSPYTSALTLLYLFALLKLAMSPTWRQAFYSGLIAGLGIAALHLTFFWTIFSAGAIALWLVFAFWIGLFVALARLSLKAWPSSQPDGSREMHRWYPALTLINPGWFLIPWLWCGLEYFRGELYYLRFSWLTAAFVLPPENPLLPVFGVYGLGFVLVSLACLSAAVWRWNWRWSIGCLGVTMLACQFLGKVDWPEHADSPSTKVVVAGVQLEFPAEKVVLVHLNELSRQFPEAQLLVLSEYTFMEALPEAICRWCREHRRWLIVGGKEPVDGGGFYNTAFVVSPQGEVVFRQAKSVPIQFFNDGRPAASQQVWNSPWGKIGLCICYDLSYRRVTDRLVEQGAQALIVPTMDVADWGLGQHALHARVAPLRAAEYRVPIFRLASSGISQMVDRTGRVTAAAPAMAEGAMIHGELRLGAPGHSPCDRWLASGASLVTICTCLWFLVRSWLRRWRCRSVGR